MCDISEDPAHLSTAPGRPCLPPGVAAAPDTQAALPPLPGQGGQVVQVQVDGAQLHQQEGGAGRHHAEVDG